MHGEGYKAGCSSVSSARCCALARRRAWCTWRRYVYPMETVQTAPTLDVLVCLAEGLEISLAELMTQRSQLRQPIKVIELLMWVHDTSFCKMRKHPARPRSSSCVARFWSVAETQA
jgi:hypothetical protein